MSIVLEVEHTEPHLRRAQKQLVDQISCHPFMCACRAGNASMDLLKRFLVQQGIYSGYFTRYLCALMANLRSNAHVRDLAQNLFEELGLAEDSQIPHFLLYGQMLEEFGLNPQEEKPTRGTLLLIDNMFSHCRQVDPAIGLGALCLGAEGLVPPMYQDLVAGFRAQGVPDETLQFFHLHISCDDDHALTLNRLMLELIDEEPECLSRIVAAGRTLVSARMTFFDDIIGDGESLKQSEVNHLQTGGNHGNAYSTRRA
ncbi:TenA family transcriptional regulator [Acidithiobacillus ferriphilus]|nr:MULTISPECIES: iron-containing redox enzyme family protein [Acidithiobacillus]MEB8474943.1 iron-containing redox enzyme family protein [Acidithiobacillus ferriphilus]